MRILHVITGLREVAGTSVFCGEIANQCVYQGHECDIYVSHFRPDQYPVDKRVRVITTLNRSDYDIVHIHGVWEPWLHFKSQWAHRHRIPVIWSPHGMLMPWAMRYHWYKKIIPWYLYQKKDISKAKMIHVTALPESVQCRALGFKQSQVIVPLGTKLPVEIAPHNSPIKRVLFLGRIQKVKGLDRLLRVWARIKDKVPTWQLVIAGPNQDAHQDELMTLAKISGLTFSETLSNTTSNICFPGALLGEAKDAAYRNARFFILPSNSENFAAVIPDALSFGIPVLTSKATPWDFLEAEGCGFSFELTDEALEKALLRMLDLSDIERKQMGLYGRALIQRDYTWPAIADKMINAYMTL